MQVARQVDVLDGKLTK